MNRFSAALFVTSFSLIALSLPAHAQKSKYPADQRRVIVAGVPVGGLDAPSMTRRLKRELQPKLRTRVSLSGGAVRVYRRRADLGIVLDLGWMTARARRGDKYVPLRWGVGTNEMKRALRQLEPRFKLAPRDARLTDNRGRVRIVSERAGQTLNMGAALARLKQQIEKSAADTSFEVPVRRQSARRTAAAFKGITGRLATYSTEFNSGNIKRTLNMRIAIRAIHNTIVPSGKLFSLNETVGERTQKRGYRTAIVFENGRKEPGIGGGVSQVTGTLFNAALLAGLPVNYQTHSRPVAYLPIGRDATVSWGDFDMKWRNNTPAPIYVSYRISGDRATATLYGRRVVGQKVSLKVNSRKIGPRRIVAQLYRVIRRNGKVVVKEKVGTSNYDWKEDKDD